MTANLKIFKKSLEAYAAEKTWETVKDAGIMAFETICSIAVTVGTAGAAASAVAMSVADAAKKATAAAKKVEELGTMAKLFAKLKELYERLKTSDKAAQAMWSFHGKHSARSADQDMLADYAGKVMIDGLCSSLSIRFDT